MPKLALRLNNGGRIVVESYHSLEDITVKRFMNKGLEVDVPANMPIIPQSAKPFFKSLTRGAIKASKEEIANNTSLLLFAYAQWSLLEIFQIGGLKTLQLLLKEKMRLCIVLLLKRMV